jgi:MFS family permease
MNTFLQKIVNERLRKGLIYAVWDGVLWAIMFGFAENYLVPFALVFGATTLQVSLIQGTAQLGVGMAQLLGAKFILKFQQRKRLAIFTSRIHAFSWLFVFVLTLLTKNPWVVLVCYSLGLFAANFGGPGWISWMNDLVPVTLRGEYWGLRNRIIGLTQFVAIAIAGISLYFAKEANREILVYGILFTLAFTARFSNFIPLGRQYEPPMSVPASTSEFRFRIFLIKLITTNFGRFALFSILMTFSVNVMAPIIPVYLLRSLELNYLQFTVIMMTAIIFSFISMTYWGPLSDLYGNYRILFTTAIAMPLLPLGWLILKNLYALILLQLFSGFVMAGFNLATTNFIFDAVRRENISKIMAYFTTLNTTCAFLGSATGGLLVNALSPVQFSGTLLNQFTTVFAVSCLLRIFVVFAFLRGFKEVREVMKSPGLHFFYIYRPAFNIINRFQISNNGRRLGMNNSNNR